MKKYITRFVALLIFGSVVASTVSSCSVEYRERHHHYDHDHDDHHDHYYHNY